MATKLKNTLLKKRTKAIAFMLAVLLFAGSGYFASMAAKSFYAYNSFGTDNFTQTMIFRHSLNQFQYMFGYGAEAMSCSSVEDYKKTSEGKRLVELYNERIKDVTEAYALLDNSGIRIHVTVDNCYRYSLDYAGRTYYFDYDGSNVNKDYFDNWDYVRVTETTASPEVQEQYNFIGNVSEAIRTIGNVCIYYNNYGEISLNDIIADIESERENTIRSAYNSEKSVRSSVANYTSISYAVYVPSTGKVVTNCGVTATDSQEQILAKLGGVYIEGKVDGEYAVFKGKAFPKLGGDIYNELLNELVGSAEYPNALKNSTRYDGGWAYFSYAPDTEGTADTLTVSNRLFDEHVDKHIRSTGTCLTLFCILFLLACAICIYLYVVAGKNENGEVVISKYDKIPFAIQTLFGLAGLFVTGAVVNLYVLCEALLPTEFGDIGFAARLAEIIGGPSSGITGIFFAGFFAIITANIMSIIRNIRNKSFRKNTLIGKVFSLLKKLCKKAKSKVRTNLTVLFSKGESKKFRLICTGIIAVVSAADFVLGFNFCHRLFVGTRFSEFLAFVAVVVLFAVQIFVVIKLAAWFERIARAVSEIRNGNIRTEIDTEGMPVIMKKFADDIEGIRDGLNEAVEGAVKDQRMKTELITNVSHDLKTPLTSIVNYVDLLKRCDVDDEDAKKYISVLDEKSQRMKKLIEDLVEASKASSGAIELHPIKINLCEFAAQTVGEYEDELKEKDIDILLKAPETPVTVTADSQKTSRIVENLFSNIKKYALEGTRVYAEVVEGVSDARLIFKNVSKNPLDISPDELVQRFVRGDASRSSEGSGLGLSIAKNLCELQGGDLIIEIDGDLFKAVVVLPK